MKYLFDLSHPAHYHLFKNLASSLLKRGDEVLFAAKQKDVLLDLLKADPDFRDRTHVKSTREKAKGIVADLSWLLENDLKMIGLCRKFRPDRVLSTTFSGIHAGRLLGIPSLYFTEDDFPYIHKVIRLVEPFADALVCPTACDPGRFTRKTIRYRSYQELSYLHPDWFTPDTDVISSLRPPYLIVRLADLRAHHDTGKQGLTDDFIRTLLRSYGSGYRIHLSAERSLPSDLEPYRFPLSPDRMHSALAGAELVIGDSATLMAEAGVLGTPAVYTGYFVGQRGYLNELESPFGLIRGVTDYNHEAMLKAIGEILIMENRREEYHSRRGQLLQQRYNPVPFYLWLLDNLPDSIRLMQSPDYDLRFLPGGERQ